jgi:hypothetical protein
VLIVKDAIKAHSGIIYQNIYVRVSGHQVRCELRPLLGLGQIASNKVSPHMLPLAAIVSTNQDYAIARFKKLAPKRSTNATRPPRNYYAMALAVHVSPFNMSGGKNSANAISFNRAVSFHRFRNIVNPHRSLGSSLWVSLKGKLQS